MPTTTAKQLIDRAQVILQDTTNTRWPRTELLNWLNDAQRQIVLHRPDAHAVNEDFSVTVQNTLQTLPANALRLIDVVRNTTGRSVTHVDRRILDEQSPNWHTENASDQVEHYIYDDRDPRRFYLYPLPTVNVSVQIVYSSAPVSIGTETDVIGLDDIYANPILDFMLYRAYSKDADYAANGQRMITHMQAFSDALGVKTQIDQFYSPEQNSGVGAHKTVR
jgi:hypothetical protein